MLGIYFAIIPNRDPVQFRHLKWRIIQLDAHVVMDKYDHIMKMCKENYQNETLPKCDMTFCTDNTVEDDHATSKLCPIEEMQKLEKQNGSM